MTRKLELLAITFALLGGCSFHASATAGTRTGARAQNDTTGREDQSGSSASREQPEARDEQLSAREGRDRAPESPSQARAEAPRAQQAQPKEHDTRSHGHDRGHGNDADRSDEDNPGKSKTAARADKKGDHDRGHGNDADGVDEDNPGRSRSKR